MPEDRFTLVLRNCLSELDTLGEQVERFCHDIGLPPKTIFQIKFCLEEIFVNIISYGYQDDQDHCIIVTVSLDRGTLILRIEDDGIPFNPLEVEPPDIEKPLDERSPGGLGLHLTRRLMDNLAYERRGAKNILTMEKNMNMVDGHNVQSL
jgi:serine/threonine-protein kinase RsbW